MKRRAEKHWIRLFTLILALLMVFALGIVASAAEPEVVDEKECYIHGDVNKDGKVDSRDAIYTLYRSALDDESYPIDQEWDFNGDASMDNKDAIYLLYAGLFPEDYELDGLIHGYFDPAWKWSDDLTAVEVTFKCSCGQDVTLSSGEEGSGLSITANVVKEASCTEPGSVEYTASVTHDGVVYTDVKTGTVPALSGHQWVGGVEPGCETGGKCEACGFELAASGHTWTLADITEATCYTEAVEHYSCDNGCGETREEVLEGTAGHNYVPLDEPMVVNADTCQYAGSWCSECEAPNLDDVHTMHQFVAVLTTPATCAQPGEKTYTCRCGATNGTEPVPANGNHTWEEVTGVEGATHQCSGCNETKLVVVADNEGKVDMTNQNTSVEVDLGNDTTISMDDETAAGLDGQVQITVTPTGKDQTGLTQEQQSQIPSDTVYDFSMVDEDGEPITEFEGSITISLPYTLEPGEDVDSIDIWYIDNEGNPVRVEDAVYNDGFVTFTTTHFSYYTVTRLTPAERCDRYGHIFPENPQVKQASCTEDGYLKWICQRCGKAVEDETHVAEVYTATGHEYEASADNYEAGCESDGLYEEICVHCDHSTKKVLPAHGHAMKLDKEHSSSASCLAPGKTVYSCGHGCGRTYEEDLPQQEHRYETIEDVEAGCTHKGHVKQKCATCDDERIKEEKAPLGHHYTVQGWTWDEDYLTATLTLVCDHDKTHTKQIIAVATSEEEKAVSCLGSGAVTYTATVSVNGQTYTDVQTVTIDAPGHKSDNVLHSNNNQHYYLCTVCGAKLNVLDHVWDEANVTDAPTCSEDGLQTVPCEICGFEKEEVVPATGAHNYIYGVCKDCGFRSEECSHEMTHTSQLNLSGYAICKGIQIDLCSCDCGENTYLNFIDFYCTQTYEMEEGVLEDGSVYTKETISCEDCGLVIVTDRIGTIDKETCTMQVVVDMTITLDKTVIAKTHMAAGDMTEEHPTVHVKQTVQLQQYGLCGGYVETTVCPCGDRVRTYSYDTCDWQYDEENGHYVCQICGTVKEYTYDSMAGEEQCQSIEIETTSFYVGGVLVYSFTNEWKWYIHDYEVIDHKLMGTSCEDGIFVTYHCTVCDETYEDYLEGHLALNLQKIDLSGYVVCADTLYQYTCPCEESFKSYHMDGENGQCMFLPEYNWQTDEETFRCQNCGAVRTETQEYGEKDENCFGVVSYICTITDTDGNSFTAVDSGYTTTHNWETSYELLGSSCVDGVVITNECTDCGEGHSSTDYYHMTMTQKTHDLSQYGLCITQIREYSCLCGEDTGIEWLGGHCQQEWIDGSENSQVWQCLNCGVIETESWTASAGDEPCQVHYTRTRSYTKDGQELLRFTYKDSSMNHNWLHELTLKEGAASCEDGVTVKAYCMTCGEINEWEESGHCSYTVRHDVYGEGQMCGAMIIEENRCACGLESWTNIYWEGGVCENFEGEYSEELGVDIITCVDCGVSHWSTGYDEPIEGDPCQYKTVWHHVYSKDGKELFSYDTEEIYNNHSIVCSFNMFGQTCEEGYNVIRSCTKCDYSFMEEAEVYYDCQTWTVEKEIVHDGTGICGEIVKNYQSCPCGKETSTSVDTGCNFNWVDDVNGQEIFECYECGAMQYKDYEIVRDRETCRATTVADTSIVVDGVTVVTYEHSWSYDDHQHIYTFDGTCEDGYYVIRGCAYCDDSYREEEMRTGHQIWRIAYHDMSEYGLCGGQIDHFSCACGRQSHIGYGNEECSWKDTGVLSEQYGVWEEYCAGCGTYRYRMSSGQRDPETCQYSYTERIVLVRDGETVWDHSFDCGYESHDSQIVGTSLNVEGGSCTDGYTILWECKDCGLITTGEGYEHENYQIKSQILSEECGTYVYWHGCVCGENYDVSYNMYCSMSGRSWDEEAEDGRVHTYHESKCDDCGLERYEDWYYVPTGNTCEYQRINNITFVLNGETLATLEDIGYEIIHDEKITEVSLLDGSTTCDNGAHAVWVCQDCGASGTYEYSWHRTMVTEEYDLSAYGSVCGGVLEHHVCACGQENRLDFSEDTKCDLDSKHTDHWIGGVISSFGQYTSEGHQWYDSYAYIYTCAVTDPACGMKIRMADYWLADGCVATRYQTWQLGYNAEDGTCAQEITIEIETRGYHNYTEASIDQTLEDGTKVSGTKYTCGTCGSTYEDRQYHLNDVYVKNEQILVNTLDNGENQKLTYMYEYGLHINGVDICTRAYDEIVEADGTVRWYQYVYNYGADPAATECLCTVEYTDSNGGSDTYTENRHHTNWDYEDTEGTCTQEGSRYWWDSCIVCQKVTDSGTHSLDPIAHSWTWNDEKQTFVCGYCQLENVNGASGEIVLEDLTDDYDGTNYVVGYWNRGEVDYILNVSVMLYDVAEGQDDQLVLSGITFGEMEDVRAVYCNKSQVQAAASAAIAEAGYTGSYAIRISFVPTSGSEELDYAITFDAQ